MSWLWILAPLFAAAAADSNYAGPGRCEGCHPAQYATQVRSRHAFALRAASETPLASLLSSQPLRERSGVSFEYEADRGGVRVRTLQGGREAVALLRWAFGAGAQAVTPVGIVHGRFFEHRISWYTAPQAPRRTLGHPGEPSANPLAALGIVQENETIYRCFNCHATAVERGPRLDSMIPGVTCERCHGPAADHAVRGVPMKRAALNRDGVQELCGSCHRLPMSSLSRTPEREDPLSIRFAPVGLAASACYRKSGTMSCLTCHNPHEDAVQDAKHYEAKCASCHSQANACTAGEQTRCLECHMPKSSPAPYLTFTDHRIRISRK